MGFWKLLMIFRNPFLHCKLYKNEHSKLDFRKILNSGVLIFLIKSLYKSLLIETVVCVVTVTAWVLVFDFWRLINLLLSVSPSSYFRKFYWCSDIRVQSRSKSHVPIATRDSDSESMVLNNWCGDSELLWKWWWSHASVSSGVSVLCSFLYV